MANMIEEMDFDSAVKRLLDDIEISLEYIGNVEKNNYGHGGSVNDYFTDFSNDTKEIKVQLDLVSSIFQNLNDRNEVGYYHYIVKFKDILIRLNSYLLGRNFLINPENYEDYKGYLIELMSATNELMVNSYKSKKNEINLGEIAFRKISNTDFSEQLKSDLKKSTDSASKQVASLEARVDALLKEVVTINSAHEDAYNKKILDLQKITEDGMMKSVGLVEQKVGESIVDLDRRIAQFEDYEVEAKRKLGVMGDMQIAFSYSNLGKKEEKSANFWRTISLIIIFFGFAVALLNSFEFIFPEDIQSWMGITHHSVSTALNANVTGAVNGATADAVKSAASSIADAAAKGAVNGTANIAVHQSVGDLELTWTGVVLRLLVAFLLLSPAIYLARESARHRLIGDKAQQTAAELLALKAFIAELEPADVAEIRKKLSDKYFGNSFNTNINKSNLPYEMLESVMKTLVEKGAEAVTDSIKSSKKDKEDKPKAKGDDDDS